MYFTSGDIICVFLGCDHPVLLREVSAGHFKVIGNCFVYGLSDSNAFLGPLPEPWKVEIHGYSLSRYSQRFFNPEANIITNEDPRLGELGDWERIERELDDDDPETCAYFRHKGTGEIMNSDPRLLPDALKGRGVKLETFALI